MSDNDELRRFLERLLGWTSGQRVERALQAIELAATHRVHLAVCGAGDLVPAAYALHRRVLGVHRPFIVCDPRRGNRPASVRAPANYRSGVVALQAAAGGSLCVRSARLPHDFRTLVAQIRSTEDVLFVVCAGGRDDLDPLLVRPAPIRLPPLARRANELPRIVDEYAAEAIAALGVRVSFSAADRAWVCENAATSLAEIEKATLRLVALRASRTVRGAAALLGITPVSLARWSRRRPPPPMTEERGPPFA